MGFFSAGKAKTKSEESTKATSTSSGTSSGTQTESGWQPVLDMLAGTTLPAIKDYNTAYGNGEGIYTGTRLGALDPNVTRGQESLLGAAAKYGTQANELQGSLQGFLNYDPNDPINQASRDALGANVRAQFNESILPGMQDQATASGQYGGNQYSLALGAATAPLSRAIADNEFNLMDADRNRALSAMGLAPEIMNTLFTQGAVTKGVGEERTNRNQLVLEDNIQKFNAPREARLRSILETQGLLTPMAGLSKTGTSSATSNATNYMDSLTKGSSESKGGGGSPFQTLLGAAATIGGAYLGGPGGAAVGSSLFGGGGASSALPGLSGPLPGLNSMNTMTGL